jgi:hypothetical protein
MRINLEALEKAGFIVHSDGKIIDIYPQERKNPEQLLQSLKELGLTMSQRIDIVETVHEYQVINAIKDSQPDAY